MNFLKPLALRWHGPARLPGHGLPEARHPNSRSRRRPPWPPPVPPPLRSDPLKAPSSPTSRSPRAGPGQDVPGDQEPAD